ncbi:uncharacterized protein LOC127877369 isoform X2 [Dreissena polymorpha]|uniref:uncharacterized protein LOC127877369 isoform X2 n=1 Tax=Dreissena polymorpha TaxID=45954 RepID=UPI0022640B5D|nr:uncharacterized protein LOC127877369 isoform X2 [Dreissena polymorpha]
MAAPMKIWWASHSPLQRVLQQCLFRGSLTAVRQTSNSSSDRDGPPAWAAQDTPTGRTFSALYFVRTSDKQHWKRRGEVVNKPWRDIIMNYGERKKQTAEIIPMDERPKLLMVQRVRTTKGRPYYELNWLDQLGIKEYKKPYILKNKENTNKILMKVRHLVEILPVTFPYGPPESDDDLDHCYMCDNGEFIVKKRLKATAQIQGEVPVTNQIAGEVPVTDQISENKYEISQKLLDKTVEHKKMKHQIHQEYYQTKYIYEYNQDKKEWRYKGNKNIGYAYTWH